MIKKLALGTVQFGLKYGISNSRGKVPESEVLEVLTYASQEGIDTLDTASAYGDSEKVLGRCLPYVGNQFKVISKFSGADKQSLEEAIKNTLHNLGQSKLYGLLMHRFEEFKNNSTIFEEYLKLSEIGLIDKVGFSLYHPDELEWLLNKNIPFKLLQVPYNVFDQRFSVFFPELQKRQIELHVRSVFLQGLVFKNLDTLESFFNPIKDRLELLGKIAEESGLSISTLCVDYALLQAEIDKVVIGVESISNLQENIMSTKFVSEVSNLRSKLQSLSFQNEKILNPSRWKL